MNVCSLGGEGFSLSFLCLVLFLLDFWECYMMVHLARQLSYFILIYFRRYVI